MKFLQFLCVIKNLFLLHSNLFVLFYFLLLPFTYDHLSFILGIQYSHEFDCRFFYSFDVTFLYNVVLQLKNLLYLLDSICLHIHLQDFESPPLHYHVPASEFQNYAFYSHLSDYINLYFLKFCYRFTHQCSCSAVPAGRFPTGHVLLVLRRSPRHAGCCRR